MQVSAKALNRAAPPLAAEVATLDDAARAVREWIGAHALGGSACRWVGKHPAGHRFAGMPMGVAEVKDGGGATVAFVAYNGRVWSPDGAEVCA